MDGRLQDEHQRSIQTVRSSRVYTRLGDAAALAVPELTLAPRLLGGVGRRWVMLLIAGTVAFTAGVTALIFVWNAANQETARDATSRFGAALIHNDPHAAPAGAAEYVSGARAYFGAITSAKLIGSHQKEVGHDPDTRSFYVAELLLDTRRGPAVLEVEFDNDSLNSDTVSSVYELAPSSAPGLSAAQHEQLDAAFTARGHELAGAATLGLAASTASSQRATRRRSAPTGTRSTTRSSELAPIPTAASNPITPAAAKRLHCVRAAHRDVTKLARCAQ